MKDILKIWGKVLCFFALSFALALLAAFAVLSLLHFGWGVPLFEVTLRRVVALALVIWVLKLDIGLKYESKRS